MITSIAARTAATEESRARHAAGRTAAPSTRAACPVASAQRSGSNVIASPFRVRVPARLCPEPECGYDFRPRTKTGKPATDARVPPSVEPQTHKAYEDDRVTVTSRPGWTTLP